MVGFTDARHPRVRPHRPRLVDASIDDVVERIVGHIRDMRPQLVVTHAAHGR
ncbi:hypothetical protein [Streptomyces sp. PSKA01]|uniref:Uncharacterized protein n=1 Tax=Streptomyces cupreus TaxID=2759956 RepID=A0A7X1MAQ7_9ACTN|nr:hypothetical protein [Streptomyces cupreus]